MTTSFLKKCKFNYFLDMDSAKKRLTSDRRGEKMNVG